VLVVPKVSERFENLLLAYDGSQKADETLYVAAYLAGRWEVNMTIITINESGKQFLKSTASSTLVSQHTQCSS
jgi:hypothetical protein